MAKSLKRSGATEGYDDRDLLIDLMLRCCIEAKATVPRNEAIGRVLRNAGRSEIARDR